MADRPPPWLSKFVIETDRLVPERHDTWDLYLDTPNVARAAKHPLVVLVHGGPVPEDLESPPRHWPVFRGYATLLAVAGTAAAVVGHPLHSIDEYASAFQVVAAAVDAARSDDRVDASRVAVWHFSGSGPMVARWLAAPPTHLRCIAMTYPVLDSRTGRSLPDGFRPINTVATHKPPIPLVLTRVGHEDTAIAAGVERFVVAAHQSAANLAIIDVPGGGHGFDMDEPTRRSQDAVRESIDRVIDALRTSTD